MLKFGTKHDSNIVFKCTVRLLEDTEILECEYKPHHKGKYLLEYVCQQLNLIEQDYLGLRYVDIQEQRHWLDLGKSICKQVKDIDPVLFSFRVKFYPPDPFRLKEEITRYQIFLQLKRDLLHGRLYCEINESAMLTALIVQGELGDYDSDIHIGNYISELRILLKQTPSIEEKAMEIHQKQLKGQSQSQIENSFLKLACQLDTYGIDPHPVKDHRGTQLYLGINYSGILTLQGSNKIHHFRWPDIQKINYEGKMFIIHLNYNEKKHTIGFKCPTGASCRHVWRCAIEQMLFFTLPTSSEAPTIVSGGGLFSLGTKFKYTGRTEKEILEDSSLSRNEPTLQRTSSVRRKASSVPATPSTPLQPHLGYSSLPRSSHSDAGGSRMESSNSSGLLSSIDGNLLPYSDVAALETVTEDPEAMGSTKLRTTVLKDDSVDRFSDYYFRDSFDHSSSESQLMEGYRGCSSGVGVAGGVCGGIGGATTVIYDTITNPSHRSSRSQTPLSQHYSQIDTTITSPSTTAAAATTTNRICLTNTTTSSHNLLTNHHQKKLKKFNILRTFIPTIIIVTIFLILFTIILLETDCELFANLKDIPELISLRYQVYEPIKQYFRNKMSIFF